VDHVWSGTLGFSFAGHPHVGRAGGAVFAAGYSGNGVALSPWLGRKAALTALGRPEGATAFAETAFEAAPWRPFMTPGNMWVASLLQRPIDWRENLAAARDRRAG
jgi:glycine/D-amino acid oxidase-like deaminating enzyme